MREMDPERSAMGCHLGMPYQSARISWFLPAAPVRDNKDLVLNQPLQTFTTFAYGGNFAAVGRD